jgi:hypothetical protein
MSHNSCRLIPLRKFNWLWLLVPTLAVLLSLRSYLTLELLSATLLFTVGFVILAAQIGTTVLLLVVVDRALE